MRLVEWKLCESEITEIADRRHLGGCVEFLQRLELVP